MDLRFNWSIAVGEGQPCDHSTLVLEQSLSKMTQFRQLARFNGREPDVQLLATTQQHFQEISLAAHPLDKDQAQAHAWQQPDWADYSGVSRTLSRLSWDGVKQIVQVLEQISQPYLSTQVQLLGVQGNRLRLDGDLRGLPVSNTSQSYPQAAFGHMADEIRLGYQAALVSLQSPTYGRLWLWVAHH